MEQISLWIICYKWTGGKKFTEKKSSFFFVHASSKQTGIDCQHVFSSGCTNGTCVFCPKKKTTGWVKIKPRLLLLTSFSVCFFNNSLQTFTFLLKSNFAMNGFKTSTMWNGGNGRRFYVKTMIHLRVQ